MVNNMPISNALLAFNDCVEVFDAACRSDRGVRVRIGTYDNAVYFRMRLHQARKLTREANQRIYDEDDPLYGRSPYDPYTVRIRNHNGEFYVYLEPNIIDIDAIEYLDEVEPEPAPPPEPEPQPAPQTIRRI
jgi:hypothetical protein